MQRGLVSLLTLMMVFAGCSEYPVSTPRLRPPGKASKVLLEPGTVVQVSAGVYHSCAVRTDGSVVCWGDGRLGEATPPVGPFTQVSVLEFSTCGLKRDGSIACWPYGPSAITGPFTQISYLCGLESDGTIACWNNGSLTTPIAGTFTQISGDCALESDGTVACWGPNPASPAGTFKQLSVSSGASCGVRTDGTLSCWAGGYGQAPPAGTFTQISTGPSHACGIKTDGTVACWGSNYYGQATPPPGQFVQVSAGSWHTCGVTTDASVVCWGGGLYQLATPPTATFAQVSAGFDISCGVKTGGALACWSANEDGRMLTSPAGTFTQVSVGWDHACALRSDGTVGCWFADEYANWGPWGDDGETNPPAGTFTQLTSGPFHTCGLKSDGMVACWGTDTYGESTPPAEPFAQIIAGGGQTCGLRPDGTIRCWGSGGLTPPAGTYTQIGTGACGLKSDGTIACANAMAPTGTFAQLGSGWGGPCAIRSDGALACWGGYPSLVPQYGVFSQVSAGGRQSCAIDEDHGVSCWGDMAFAESPRPPRIISIKRAGGAVDPILLGPEGANAFIDLTFFAQRGTDPVSASISCGNGTTLTPSGIVTPYTATCTYADPGVYTVRATVSNFAGPSPEATYQYVVVYDPSAGFVTGAGWITSPPGAYTADPTLTGKATFGFVTQYHKGATTPSGNTEFQFKQGNLNFAATSFDWLVISGAKARFKGVGKINGQGDYAFQLTAIDGQVNGGGGIDRFRIKIWERATSRVVYDNELGTDENGDPTTAVGGGSIVIHK